MAETVFNYKGKQYRLKAWGIHIEYYASAVDEQGKMIAHTETPTRSYDKAFDQLQRLIIEQADAVHYIVGGERLIASIRATNHIPKTYIGRLAFEDKGIKKGLVIAWVEGDNEDQAFLLLDDAVNKFAARDGFQAIKVAGGAR